MLWTCAFLLLCLADTREAWPTQAAAAAAAAGAPAGKGRALGRLAAAAPAAAEAAGHSRRLLHDWSLLVDSSFTYISGSPFNASTDTISGVGVYFLDWSMTSSADVAQLKSQGLLPICVVR